MLYDIFAVVICGAILILCMLVPVLIGSLIEWIADRRREKRREALRQAMRYMTRVDRNRRVTIDECNKYAEEARLV